MQVTGADAFLWVQNPSRNLTEGAEAQNFARSDHEIAFDDKSVHWSSFLLIRFTVRHRYLLLPLFKHSMEPNNCEADFPAAETTKNANPIYPCSEVEQTVRLYYISILKPLPPAV